MLNLALHFVIRLNPPKSYKPSLFLVPRLFFTCLRQKVNAMFPLNWKENRASQFGITWKGARIYQCSPLIPRRCFGDSSSILYRNDRVREKSPVGPNQHSSSSTVHHSGRCANRRVHSQEISRGPVWWLLLWWTKRSLCSEFGEQSLGRWHRRHYHRSRQRFYW